jgi:hypothetical protein
MKTAFIVAALAAVLRPATAHYVFTHFIHNGDYTGHYEFIRENTNYYMPTKSVEGDDFRCNTGSFANAGKTGVRQVQPGDEIGFGLAYDATILHPGPLSAYMSKAPSDVHEYDGSGDWFKIYELGPTDFTPEGIEWGVTGKANFTFPLSTETPPGQYLVRIEHIAIHGAQDLGGAEFYFTCAQIEVGGNSDATPDPTVKIPGVYSATDPGIHFNMYYPLPTSYPIPGPSVWPGEGTSSVGAADATSSVPSPAVTNAVPSASLDPYGCPQKFVTVTVSA